MDDDDAVSDRDGDAVAAEPVAATVDDGDR